MNGAFKEVVRFKDRFGDERVLTQRGKKRFAIQAKKDTPINPLNRAAAKMIGHNIRRVRISKGLTLEQLALRAGLTGIPKVRMWEIENSLRGGGIRTGTLYAIALALNVDLHDLLPSPAEVKEAAAIEWHAPAAMLAVKQDST